MAEIDLYRETNPDADDDARNGQDALAVEDTRTACIKNSNHCQQGQVAQYAATSPKGEEMTYKYHRPILELSDGRRDLTS
uniref:Uncharacterized protein n=1 Tax=Oryza rufipogon TaxID=4529 RepID=A0A0E0PT00_ORYRU